MQPERSRYMFRQEGSNDNQEQRSRSIADSETYDGEQRCPDEVRWN
jgi:hypothetical protein